MELQNSGIRNIEVFNQRSKCTANHGLTRSCGDMSCIGQQDPPPPYNLLKYKGYG